MMFEAQTEWISPESFPDLTKHDYIAIDLETRDPGLKSKGSGALVNNGEIIGVAVAVDGWSGYFSFGHSQGNFFGSGRWMVRLFFFWTQPRQFF